MPTFEFSCATCEVLFEEILLQSSEIEKYREWHPCPHCGGRANREKVSLMNFAFKAPSGQTAGTGVHGQSGVHDLDYPKLDKAIGRSAVTKWQTYDARKKERDKLRKEVGSNAIAIGPGGKARAMDKNTATIREKALTTFQKIKKV